MATLRNAQFGFDPEDLKPKCTSVYDLLEDLIKHFRFLMEDNPSPLQKGVSRPAQVSLTKIKEALSEIQKTGHEEVLPSADKKYTLALKRQIEKTLGDVDHEGKNFYTAAHTFTSDPLNVEKRQEMISASRTLVREVTRLLILADYVDVANIVELVNNAEHLFANVRHSKNKGEFMSAMQDLGAKCGEIYVKTGHRQEDILPEQEDQRYAIAVARQNLKDAGIRLITAENAYFANPNLLEAEKAQTDARRQFQEALKRIAAVIKGDHFQGYTDVGINAASDLTIPADIGEALDDFDMNIPDPIDFDSQSTPQDLQSRLEKLIEGAAAIADLGFTTPNRKDQIVSSCEAVRAALSGLLSDYMNASKSGQQMNFQDALDHLIEKNRALRDDLRRAAGDQIGDAFLNAQVPFLNLYSLAKKGDKASVDDYSPEFIEHSTQMVESAKISAFTISKNPMLKAKILQAAEAVSEMVQPAANSAKMLASDNQQKCYIEHMDVVMNEWELKLANLVESVNESVELVDFLATAQEHILKEIGDCVLAAEEKNATGLDNAAGLICGRVQRVCEVVLADIEQYEPDFTTEQVKEATQDLKEINLPEFSKGATDAVENINENRECDKEEIIRVSNELFAGVNQVFRAVLQTRSPHEYAHLGNTEPDSFRDEQSGVTGLLTEDTIDSTEAAERAEVIEAMTVEQQVEIKAEIADFQQIRDQAHQEFDRWDDDQNDLITIAKKMSAIMKQMTDYQTGEGPLQTNKELIRAAKKLSEYGTKLNNKAAPIAKECSDKHLSNNLESHLAKIDPLQHQLKLLSRVKQEVESVAGDLVVSGLESINSLVQNAKNLLRAVLETVRAAHTCSIRLEASPVVWRPKVPKKVPLMKSKDQNQKEKSRKIVRRETNKLKKQENTLMDFINIE